MKTLYLIRHAKSDRSENIEDIDRPLNEKGYSDAHKMSLVLKAKKIIPDLVISSPAIRALSTALIFCRKINYDPKQIVLNKNLYNTSVKEYLKCISDIKDDYQTILLFGHNPIISDTANTLAPSLKNEMPTCAIVGISGEVDSWKTFTKKNNALKIFDFQKITLNLIVK